MSQTAAATPLSSIGMRTYDLSEDYILAYPPDWNQKNISDGVGFLAPFDDAGFEIRKIDNTTKEDHLNSLKNAFAHKVIEYKSYYHPESQDPNATIIRYESFVFPLILLFVGLSSSNLTSTK